MSPLIRAILVAAGLAIVGVVVYHQFFKSSEEHAWQLLGAAERANSVQALEAARDQTASGTTRPWIDFALAMQLYDTGGKEGLDRAKQVAQEALADHPDHATAPWLQRLVTAVSSYESSGPAQ